MKLEACHGRHMHVLCGNVFINVTLICKTALSVLKSLERAVKLQPNEFLFSSQCLSPKGNECILNFLLEFALHFMVCLGLLGDFVVVVIFEAYLWHLKILASDTGLHLTSVYSKCCTVSVASSNHKRDVVPIWMEVALLSGRLQPPASLPCCAWLFGCQHAPGTVAEQLLFCLGIGDKSTNSFYGCIWRSIISFCFPLMCCWC